MSDINWGLAVNRTNPFAEFTQGMEQGRQRRQDEDRANLFAEEQKYRIEERRKKDQLDREERMARGILGHVAKTDPRAAATKAVEVGQYDLADQFSKLDANQRKIARDNAEDLGGFAATIKAQVPDVGQRKAIIAQARETLKGYGLKDEQIDAFEPTDDNLQGLIAQSMTLTQALQEQNRQRDDKRAEARDAEMAEYREAMKGFAGDRVALARQREGRVASGGGGKKGGGKAKSYGANEVQW
jgi:hypothetical protein